MINETDRRAEHERERERMEHEAQGIADTSMAFLGSMEEGGPDITDAVEMESLEQLAEAEEEASEKDENQDNE